MCWLFRSRDGMLNLALGVLIAAAFTNEARSQEGQPDKTLKPLFGSVALKVDFSPDPFQKEITAGGPIKTNLGGVDTHISKEPTFVLDYTSGQFPLSIFASGGSGSTILINMPDNSWVADQLNRPVPKLRFVNPPSGRYTIWVGTIAKAKQPAILQITEVDDVHDVFTLKYATPQAASDAAAAIRKDFKRKAHVLAAHGPFIDVFHDGSNKGGLDVPTDRLDWAEYVSRVYVPRPLPTPLAAARGGEKPETIVSGGLLGKRGKNVIVAVIDGGIDFRLPDFWTTTPAGKKESRLLYYWDTSERDAYSGDEGTTRLTATYPNGQPMGRLYSRKNLSDELNRPQNPAVWEGGKTKIQTDVDGHGTGCAAIAVGQGRPDGSTLPGVAPDADLVFVRLVGLYQLNAVCEWLDQVAKAEGKPLVISLSQGTAWGGGYDGLRGEDQHLNSRFALDKKGFAACLCAGNEGRGDYNRHVVIDPKGKREVTINWDAPVSGVNMMVFYLNTPDLSDVSIKGPQADLIGLHRHNASGTLRTGEFSVAQGKGEVTFTATGNRPVAIDAYIRSSHPMSNKGKIWTNHDGKFKDSGRRINSPATIANTITVASYNWAEDYDKADIGWLSPYSSQGPRRGDPGGVAIPWVTSPGHKFVAPIPNQRGVRKDFNGTSAATPYTAGFVALMFESNKDLTFGQVRELLSRNGSLTRENLKAVDRGPPVLFPDSDWGYGKLDFAAARRILTAAAAR